MDLFKADASTDTWKAYVDYLDDMVVDGFFNCIHCSLHYLLENTDSKTCRLPLFEARMELQVYQLKFAELFMVREVASLFPSFAAFFAHVKHLLT